MQLRQTLKKIWRHLKPPLTLKEAKAKGPLYLGLIILFYLVRDLLLYVVLPLTACKAICN